MSTQPECELATGDEESECWSQCQAGRDGDCYHPECPQETAARQPRCPHDLLCAKHDERKIFPVIRKAKPAEPTPAQWRELAIAAYPFARHVPEVAEIARRVGFSMTEGEESGR